ATSIFRPKLTDNIIVYQIKVRQRFCLILDYGVYITAQSLCKQPPEIRHQFTKPPKPKSQLKTNKSSHVEIKSQRAQSRPLSKTGRDSASILRTLRIDSWFRGTDRSGGLCISIRGLGG